MIGDLKRALREEVGAALKRLPGADRAAASAKARALLVEQTLWQEARSILFYAPMAGELDVWPLLEQTLAAGKTAALPKWDAATKAYVARQVRDPVQDVRTGHYGIREPAACRAGDVLTRLDLILVPGVAFDRLGRRLGRGKGYYDRLLATVRGTTCAVAFDEQIVRAVPVEPHDIVLNCILTPTRWIEL
jgi:5-formyltetrahydrofolate cyclo-ligase